MSMSRLALVLLLPFLLAAPANAQTIDDLKGKFGFNWATNPSREKCVKVEGKLLADFKSANYKCDLTVITNTASGAPARVCTLVKGKKKEYLIFDTQRACNEERKTQASNS